MARVTSKANSESGWERSPVAEAYRESLPSASAPTGTAFEATTDVSPSPANSVRPIYGAFELKRNYQRGLSWGIILAAVVHLGAIEGWVLYRHLQESSQPVVVREVVLRSLSDLAAPPSLIAAKPQVRVADPGIVPPSIGIPVPVPDEEVVEQVQFATREDLAQLSIPSMSNDGGAVGAGDSVVYELPTEEYFPSPDEFVAVQELPILVKEVKPVYPELALLTGKEAAVWIKALVDQSGKVREARVAKSSESSVGFDEAAVEAAYLNVYKPAIQNGRPVAVWITYRVEFVVN